MGDLPLLDMCCAPLADDRLAAEDAGDLATSFKALADPVRLQLLSLLLTADDREVCACDLVVPVERSQPTVSHHLRVLREAGLVHSERRGTNIWYSVRTGRLEALRAAIAPPAAH